MRISYNSYKTHKLLRYHLNCPLFSSLSPKTLNPNYPVNAFLSDSLRTIPSLCNSLSGSPSFCSSDLFPPKKRHFLGNSSSGSSSNCSAKQCLLVKNHLLGSSYWSCSKWNLESNSSYRKLSFCYLSYGCPTRICSLTHSVLQPMSSPTVLNHESRYICLNLSYSSCGNVRRCSTFSSSEETFISHPVVESEVKSAANVCSDKKTLEKNYFPRKFVLDIIDIIRNNGENLESRLSMLGSRLSVYSITEVFEVLNYQKVSGLRFFKWIWCNIPQLHKNPHVCSLVIDNIGRVDDYDTMFMLLKEFRSKNICLTYEAFGFLPVLGYTNSSLEESTKRVVELLNSVGGSCRNSGVFALVEMFSKLDLFEMARYVIKITESKESYYCILIREMCRRGLIEDAHTIIKEMKEAHLVHNATVYNYLLGSLCKHSRLDEASALLDEMKEIGIFPDEITFEILISSVCSSGKLNVVRQLLDQMVSRGLEPRLATHTAIIKTLFAAEKYEAAHHYVVDSSIIYKTPSNTMYSLLANLYREKGDIMSARHTLVEMMEKSLKPNFDIYMKIVKQLKRAGRTRFARDLEVSYYKFVSRPHGGHL